VKSDMTQTLITWTTSKALLGGMFDRLACNQENIEDLSRARDRGKTLSRDHVYATTPFPFPHVHESAQTCSQKDGRGASITRGS